MRVQETAAPTCSPCCSSQERTFNSGMRFTSTTSLGLLRFSFICAMRSVPPASGRPSPSARERRSIASGKLWISVYKLAHHLVLLSVHGELLVHQPQLKAYNLPLGYRSPLPLRERDRVRGCLA